MLQLTIGESGSDHIEGFGYVIATLKALVPFAWPFVVFGIVLILRQPLSTFMARLKRLSAPGLVELEATEAVIADVTEKTLVVAQESEFLLAKEEKLAKSWFSDKKNRRGSPRDLIIQSWSQINDEIARFVAAKGITGPTSRVIEGQLFSPGMLSDANRNAIQSMRLVNSDAHNDSINFTIDQANRFAVAVKLLAEKMKGDTESILKRKGSRQASQ